MFQRKNRKIILIVALTAALLLAISSIAVADVIHNDVIAGGNDTFTKGESTTIDYYIGATSGDGESGCNASDGTAAIVTILIPEGTDVTATPSSLEFTSCQSGSIKNSQSVDFTSDTPGDYSIEVSVNDSGTGTYNTNPATFTLHVVGSEDNTAPVLNLPADITTEATGASGAVVNFTVSAHDDVDGDVDATCDADSGDTFPLGDTTVSCSATDVAGNTAYGSFTITVQDTTPPELTLPDDITAEATGPSGAAVEFSVSATDLVDGDVEVTCDADSGDTFPLGDTTVSCSATDAAGNTAYGSFTITVQDTTPPELTLPDDITNEATGLSGATVTFSATANDLVDGPVAVTCVPASGSNFPLGTTKVDCSATDAHSNTATGSFNVTVQVHPSGFYQPVDMGTDVYNTVKGGSTVPIKFEIFAGIDELTDTGAIEGYTAAVIACPIGGYTADPIETLTTGNTSLRYDPIAGQFILNWKTPKSPGACLSFTVAIRYGPSLVAYFKLK
jgi:hypothetical protein